MDKPKWFTVLLLILCNKLIQSLVFLSFLFF